MKFPHVLAIACCSIVVVLSKSTESSEQALLARASAQLERLAPYRRISTDQEASEDNWQLLNNVAKDPGKAMLDEERMAFEIYRILPEDMQQDIARKVGGNREMIQMLADPKYMEMMQERIKRSGQKRGTKRDGYEHGGYQGPPQEGGYPPHEYGGYEPHGGYSPDGYGGGEHHEYGPHPPGSDSGGIIKGSTGLISGIAKGIIGGLVSASGSASKGSSSISGSSSAASSSSSASSSNQQHRPEYGHVYSYGDKAFDVWDFKKAIISTLMQAVKAISGGVIALKGQLIKGSGYLLSTKSRIVTSTGDAITTLGRNIAKSVVQTHAHPEPPHHGYSYHHSPESLHSGHEENYEGPPPSLEEGGVSSEEYHSNSNYESPSDVDDQAGLLIVKPSKPDNHEEHHSDLDHEKPTVTHSEEHYHGPPPGLHENDDENTIGGNVDAYQNLNDVNHEEPHHPPSRPPSSYDVPLYYHTTNENLGQKYPSYPPLGSGSPLNLPRPVSIQQSVEYPPLHIRYTVPDKGILDLPHKDPSNNDLSVYTSFSIDTEPELGSIKLSGVKPGGGFDLPKLQPAANFHNLPLLPNAYAGAALQQPLKIPLLTPFSTPHWPNQGLLPTIGSFDPHGLYRRRSNAHRRRSVGNVAHPMRLQRV